MENLGMALSFFSAWGKRDFVTDGKRGKKSE